MTVHTLKSWSHFFKAIENGSKKHDLRDCSDRDFKVGDILILQEYHQFLGYYSGKQIAVEVTYITSRDTPCAFSLAVLNRNYCILSLNLLVSSDYEKSHG